MHLLKHRSMRFYLGFFLVLALTIGGSAIAAFADTPQTQVAVNGAASGITESASNVSASGVTLDGTNKTATYTLPITVSDDTGAGAGWHLTITSTQFDTAGNNCQTTTGYHTLSTTASQVTGVTPTDKVGGGTYNDPTNTVSYVSPILIVPAGCPAPTLTPPVELYNATAGTGMGDFIITPTVTISIPANTYAGTYYSTVSLGIASGP